MSTRIKSAAVAIVIAVVLLIAHSTFLFNIAIGFISALAIYEILRATKMTEHKYETIACCAFAAVDALMPVFHRHGWLYFVSYKFYMGLFVIAMCLLYLKEHTKFNYMDFFFMLGVGILIPYSFSTILSMSAIGSQGVFMIVLSLAAAWLADSGAYFAGTFFGKTPLCPEISPKKTVEGLVGGVISNGVLMLIISLFYQFVLKGAPVHYLGVLVAGMLSALIGLVGDLTASIIKRQTGIKDYGKIMPGHGGIMDRFDSVLLVAPFMYYMFSQGLILK
ncbi:phosphatidate cytidylyltransferase [Ruminococcus sp.]|uniref:phosphatidate cytidylyltransferase n=1 Tax=Ruminococcus sp. TaxID=41978 RepID=UPI0025E84B3A|nr:phosphatidate cytidylyltransferase [Ruminococcus sp.]